jgi:hypothetical protein
MRTRHAIPLTTRRSADQRPNRQRPAAADAAFGTDATDVLESPDGGAVVDVDAGVGLVVTTADVDVDALVVVCSREIVVVVVVDVVAVVVVVVLEAAVVLVVELVDLTVVVVVVVVDGLGGGQGAANTSGRYRRGSGQASRNMLRALFDTETTTRPRPSRHGMRCA